MAEPEQVSLLARPAKAEGEEEAQPRPIAPPLPRLTAVGSTSRPRHVSEVLSAVLSRIPR